jgi:hypothetical protein
MAETVMSFPAAQAHNETAKTVAPPGEIIMTKAHFWMIAMSMTVVITACDDRNQPAGSSSSSISNPQPKSTAVPPGANDVTDQWLGKWIGPEGTYLVLTKNAGKYVVEIHSLDGPATFEGISGGDRIEFQRNLKPESIHAGNGHETGMKWLLDKKNCLIIRTGEGFCRD